MPSGENKRPPTNVEGRHYPLCQKRGSKTVPMWGKEPLVRAVRLPRGRRRRRNNGWPPFRQAPTNAIITRNSPSGPVEICQVCDIWLVLQHQVRASGFLQHEVWDIYDWNSYSWNSYSRNNNVFEFQCPI
jgi:hypothetical protein